MSKKAEIPSYDLSQRRPKVLLVGNGIVKQNGISTEEIIRETCNDGFNFDYFEEYLKDDLIPYPILSMISSDTNDSVRQNKYLQVFENADFSKELVEKLSKLNFDAILTTNYTYEFEDCFVGNYSSLKNKDKAKYAESMSRENESRQLIYTCNCFDEKLRILHIHGELRRKSSLILNHDEYARLIKKILKYNENVGNKYEKFFNDLKIKSWIDYFMIADIYVLGLGFGFEEFDLWWLLCRRMRECNSEIRGNIIFYEPRRKEDECKYMSLNCCGVEVEHLDTSINHSTPADETYQEFYKKAIKDISSKLASVKTLKSATRNAIDSAIVQENNEAS